MAETFEALRQGPGGFSRRVCLKLVRPALRQDEQSIKLFEREARLAAKLHHSNIVSVVDFGELDDTLFMALELVDGVDLQTLLASRRRLPPEIVVLIGHELALALEHAHERLDEDPILHRDVSPSNVLISRNGEVKLTDFGLANVASSGTPLSSVKGKFPYMSPERLRDEPIDARSDLFALGVVLFEALAGRRPYDGGHDPATIMLIVEGSHPPLCELEPDAPEALCAIVEALIEPDPSNRPSSASVLIEQLEDLVPPPSARRKLGKMVVATPGYTKLGSSESEPSPTPSAAVSELTSSGRARRRFTRIAAALFLVTAGGAAYALWPRPEQTDKRVAPGPEPLPQVPIAPAPRTPPDPDASLSSVDTTEEEHLEVAPAPPPKPPPPARLTVLVSPWGNVWINGKARGAAPLKSANLKPGRHKISAGQEGPSMSRTVRLKAGQRKTIRFNLAK
jgi:serine/threonine protein kinase